MREGVEMLLLGNIGIVGIISGQFHLLPRNSARVFIKGLLASVRGHTQFFSARYFPVSLVRRVALSLLPGGGRTEECKKRLWQKEREKRAVWEMLMDRSTCSNVLKPQLVIGRC